MYMYAYNIPAMDVTRHRISTSNLYIHRHSPHMQVA